MLFYVDLLTKSQRTVVLVTPTTFADHRHDYFRDKRELFFKILLEIFRCTRNEANWFMVNLNAEDCWVNYREGEKQFRLNVRFPTMDGFVGLHKLKPILAVTKIKNFYITSHIPWEFQNKREDLEKEVTAWKDVHGYDYKHKIDYDVDDMIVTLKRVTAPKGTRRTIMPSKTRNLIHYAITHCKGKITTLTRTLGFTKGGQNLRDVTAHLPKPTGELREKLQQTVEKSQRKNPDKEQSSLPTEKNDAKKNLSNLFGAETESRTVREVSDPEDAPEDVPEECLEDDDTVMMNVTEEDMTWDTPDEDETKKSEAGPLRPPDRQAIIDRLGAAAPPTTSSFNFPPAPSFVTPSKSVPNDPANNPGIINVKNNTSVCIDFDNFGKLVKFLKSLNDEKFKEFFSLKNFKISVGADKNPEKDDLDFGKVFYKDPDTNNHEQRCRILNYAMSIRKMLKKLSKATPRSMVEKVWKPDRKFTQVTFICNPGLLVVAIMKVFLPINDLSEYNCNGVYRFEIKDKNCQYDTSNRLERVAFDIMESKSGRKANIMVCTTTSKIQLNGDGKFDSSVSSAEYIADNIIYKELEKVDRSQKILIQMVNDRITMDARTSEFKKYQPSPMTRKRTSEEEEESPGAKRKRTSNTKNLIKMALGDIKLVEVEKEKKNTQKREVEKIEIKEEQEKAFREFFQKKDQQVPTINITGIKEIEDDKNRKKEEKEVVEMVEKLATDIMTEFRSRNSKIHWNKT